MGHAGRDFLLFGMLFHSNEGKLCLEDVDGKVELDLATLVSPGQILMVWIIMLLLHRISSEVLAKDYLQRVVFH